MIIGQSALRMGYIQASLAWGSGITPAINTFGRDDVAMGSIQSALKPTQLSQRRQTAANFTTTSTTYADVPNLRIPIARGGLYVFDYWLLYETNDVAEGIGVQVAFSGSGNGEYAIDAFTDLSTRAPLVLATLGGVVAPYAAGPGVAGAVINIRGSYFIADPGGDLALQVRAETGGANSATIRASSWARAAAEPGP